MRFIYLALFLILTSNANADVKWKVLDYDEKKEYFVVSALDSLHFAYSYKRTTEHPFKMQNFIMMTEDGGKTWEERWTYNWNPTETVKIYDVGYIEYLNKDTILAGCTEGLILRSTDGGRNWDSTFLESDNAISSLNFYNSKNGVVKNHNDYMYLTDDAGYSYVKISLPDSLLNDSFGFWNGYRISEKKIIFLCGGFHYPPGEHREDAYFKVVKTEDNGKTWQSSDSLYTRVQYLNIINDSTYFAAGNTNGVDWRPVILKSNDWGMNWEKIWVDSTAYNSMGGGKNGCDI